MLAGQDLHFSGDTETFSTLGPNMKRVIRYKSDYRIHLLLISVAGVVKNINLLAGFGEFEALTNFHFLLDRIVFQAIDPLLFLHIFPQNLLVLLLVFRNLVALGQQCGNAARAFENDESVSNAGKNHNRVGSLQSGISHN